MTQLTCSRAKYKLRQIAARFTPRMNSLRSTALSVLVARIDSGASIPVGAVARELGLHESTLRNLATLAYPLHETSRAVDLTLRETLKLLQERDRLAAHDARPCGAEQAQSCASQLAIFLRRIGSA